MHVVDLIRKKRDGEALTDAEIAYLVAGAATNSIPEYQLASWLMAVVWRGLSPEELHSLTTHMRDSGRVGLRLALCIKSPPNENDRLPGALSR